MDMTEAFVQMPRPILDNGLSKRGPRAEVPQAPGNCRSGETNLRAGEGLARDELRPLRTSLAGGEALAEQASDIGLIVYDQDADAPADRSGAAAANGAASVS
jgi:hypothetical protein